MRQHWYLDSYTDEDAPPRRIGIHASPFVIGRKDSFDIHYSLPCKTLSSVHAELRIVDDALWIRDRDSSNGTFVNSRRILKPTLLNEGDVIHLAKHEFLVGCNTPSLRLDTIEDEDRTATHFLGGLQLARRSVAGVAQFRDLLKTMAVTAVFQPIVSITPNDPVCFELLGRGIHPELPNEPDKLFKIAAEIQQEAQLSRLFEVAGLCDLPPLPPRSAIFINIHPKELHGEQLESLLGFLERQRSATPELGMVIEIPESAVLARDHMTYVGEALRALNIKVAYDDFGAGQTRLLELIEAPCDFLKFDRSMIMEIDAAATPRRTLLASLVRLVQDLGITCIAEGIESKGEWEACLDLGFTSGQGFHFGRPEKASAWTGERLAAVRSVTTELKKRA